MDTEEVVVCMPHPTSVIKDWAFGLGLSLSRVTGSGGNRLPFCEDIQAAPGEDHMEKD